MDEEIKKQIDIIDKVKVHIDELYNFILKHKSLFDKNLYCTIVGKLNDNKLKMCEEKEYYTKLLISSDLERAKYYFDSNLHENLITNANSVCVEVENIIQEKCNIAYVLKHQTDTFLQRELKHIILELNKYELDQNFIEMYSEYIKMLDLMNKETSSKHWQTLKFVNNKKNNNYYIICIDDLYNIIDYLKKELDHIINYLKKEDKKIVKEILKIKFSFDKYGRYNLESWNENKDFILYGFKMLFKRLIGLYSIKKNALYSIKKNAIENRPKV